MAKQFYSTKILKTSTIVLQSNMTTITSDKFEKYFHLTDEEASEMKYFPNPLTPWFSIQKNYPKNTMFTPAKNKLNEDDSVAMIWIGLRLDHPKKDGKIPIQLKISKQSKYLMYWHFDYDFSEDKSPTKESLEISNQSLSPISIEIRHDYTFDLEHGTFYKKWTAVNPRKILDDIYTKHINSVKLRGIFFRLKIYLEGIWTNIRFFPIYFLIKSLKFLLMSCFGRDVDKNQRTEFLPIYSRADLRTLTTDKLTIGGFEINITKQSFFSVCAIVILTKILFTYDLIEMPIQKFWTLWSDDLFKWSLIILMVWFYDQVIPRIVLWLVNSLSKIASKI